ncbi:MAG: MBL fold metallo-hydrolase, partial [Cyanobacteria bacterium P01_A01_bin.135]
MADIHSLTTSDHPPADVVLCSHAHPDHARGLRALHQVYPKLPIYASDVTSRLVEFNWEGPTPRFCQTVSWRSPLQLAPQLTLQLWPAGHFPGAAVAVLTYEGEQTYKAVYAADLTLSNSRLVDGFPLEELRNLKPDVLIIEGNYGTARHPRRRQQENQLAAKISQSLSHQRSVVLPTSVLGMGPELLMLLRSHHHFTGQDINIWVSDGIADVCDTYLKLLDNFPATVQNFARHQALFWDDRIRPYVRRLGSVSQVVAQRSDLNILIAEPSTNLELCYDLYPGPWLMMLPDKPGRPSPVAAQVRAQVRASERLQASLETGALLLDTYLLNSHCD